ncbi:DinB family protein [bacterium]|nr:DinB family protein [bacterium]
MSDTTLATSVLKELEAEANASRRCLERIPERLFGWKPHEKSMPMGYLSLLVAEIPKWITHTIKDSEIDFATFQHLEPKTGADLVKHLDENLAEAKQALQKVMDGSLDAPFYLKNQGQVLFSSSKRDMILPMVNHLVHHRGQLTIYMRLNNIPVPSIYGPSADEQVF